MRRRVEHCNTQRESLPAERVGARGPGDVIRQPLQEQERAERYARPLHAGIVCILVLWRALDVLLGRCVAAAQLVRLVAPRRMRIRTRRRTRRGRTWCSARRTMTVWSRVPYSRGPSPSGPPPQQLLQSIMLTCVDYTLFFLMLPFLHVFTVLFLALLPPIAIVRASRCTVLLGRC